MKITEIAFAAYAITDVARARAFYEGVLGLEPAVTHIKDNQNAFIEYWIGAGREHCLVIGAGAPEFQPGKTGATVALEVEDFDQAVQHLTDHQVPLLMPRYDGPMCSVVLVADPDGNQVMIHRRKKREWE